MMIPLPAYKGPKFTVLSQTEPYVKVFFSPSERASANLSKMDDWTKILFAQTHV